MEKGNDATSWAMRILGMIGWVIVIACLMVDPGPIVTAGEHQGWLSVLKFPHKAFIFQAIATLAFIGMTYHFVGKVWRDLLIVAGLIIVQLVKMPALLTEPGRVFQKTLAEIAALGPAGATVTLILNTTLVVFFAGLFVVALTQRRPPESNAPWMRRDGAGLG
jgi:hypothetical protein